MSQKITADKLAEMETAYFEKPSINYVAKKVKVSYPCVKKYCEKFRWKERAEKQLAKVQRKVDSEIVERRARHATLGKFMQKKGYDGLQKIEIDDGRLAKELIM